MARYNIGWSTWLAATSGAWTAVARYNIGRLRAWLATTGCGRRALRLHCLREQRLERLEVRDAAGELADVP
jgi:hypothetical protein